MNIQNIADRAAAYGIPGTIVDGNAVLAVYEAARKAFERARTGLGPTLIECKTYRRKGHSRVDPAKYRPKEEVEQWLAKDPIKRLRQTMLEGKILTQAEMDGIEKEVAEEVADAVKFALDSPYPDGEEALEDVYS
jgi:pyruvate dehydrogenase E1 component alpha subunit